MASSDRAADEVIGENIRRHRVGLSQEGLAAAMREIGHPWSQATVWSIEAGRRAVRLSEVRDLVDVLGVSVDDLIAMPADVQRRGDVTHQVNVLASHLYSVRRGNEGLPIATQNLEKAVDELRKHAKGGTEELLELADSYIEDAKRMMDAIAPVTAVIQQAASQDRYWAIMPETVDV